MDDLKKMQFVAHMTAQALNHAARTPNVISPKGEMSHDKKLGFVHKMTKEGLQHFDAGGTVLSGPGTATTGANTGTVGLPGTSVINSTLSNNLPSNVAIPLESIINPFSSLQNGFQAAGTPLQAGTNTGQLNSAYTGAQSGLTAQQGLTNTLTPQAATAVQNQNNLATQYANEAAGKGPNPAMAELAQETGQNVAATNATIAGARGSSGNVGLLARQAAQTGAGIQQGAVGQAATLGAEQQLAAQSAGANLANNQINQTGQATTNLNSANQGEQGVLQGANTALNSANVSATSNQNNVNAQTAAANQNANSNVFGGILNGASSVLSALAEGGEVGGDSVNEGTFQPAPSDESSAPSAGSTSTLPAAPPIGGSSGGKSSGGSGGGIAAVAALLAKGGPVKKGWMNHLACGGAAFVPDHNMKSGGRVIAKNAKEKAKVAGDSYSNDTVPALLSEGEEVIDRDTMRDPGPMGQMARLLAAHMKAKKGKKVA